MSEAPWPTWVENIDNALSYCAQFVLYGNVRDPQMTPYGRLDVSQVLAARLDQRGFDVLLAYDTVDGLRLLQRERAEQVMASLPVLDSLGVTAAQLASGAYAPLSDEGAAGARTNLEALVRQIYASPMRCGLVLENPARLLAAPDRLEEAELLLFSSIERHLRTAGAHAGADGQQLFNPVVWLVDQLRDLPSWLVAAGERSRAIALPTPSESRRGLMAARYGGQFAQGAAGADLDRALSPFVRLTEGLRLSEMEAVAQIAAEKRIGLDRIADAVRLYKVGVADDPWRQESLRTALSEGEERVRKLLKGQNAAVLKTLDVLKRAALGLSGAQGKTSVGRPRGVLFFAGPTGVGKTQLAKAVAELVFGTPDSLFRVDMSEYTSEHSEARLIGAPPGYVGFNNGGALVNRIREQPFSVLLFDEIEKAHPRILDKFLQILEDGRLTDGRGDTVHFSEAVIIFTSNLGVSRRVERGGRIVSEPLVEYGADYKVVEKAVRDGVAEYFHDTLQRPEILNRIGPENVLVFDFIDKETAREIFAMNLEAVADRVRAQVGVDLRISEAARQTLEAAATSDEVLAFGGRGIGNKLEDVLINPLSRALFDGGFGQGETVTVARVGRSTRDWSVELEHAAST